jgi:hypothetical protein
MAADHLGGAKSRIERRTIFPGTKIAGNVFIEGGHHGVASIGVTVLIAAEGL